MQKIKSYMKMFFFFILDSFFIYLFRIFNDKVKVSSVLVRVDEIGDYILFRNILFYFKEKEGDFCFIGNESWKSLSLYLDRDMFASSIWINTKKFKADLLYRVRTIYSISKIKTVRLINPTYSREFIVSDSIVRIISSKFKIGFLGDENNTAFLFKKIVSNQLYTTLISSEKDICFEFDRNKEFFEKLYSEKLSCELPTIKLCDNKNMNHYEDIGRSRALLFVGGSDPIRRWNIHNYLKIAEFLYINKGIESVICGTTGDVSAVDLIKISEVNYVKNLIGETSLVELLYLIDKVEFVISNESCVPHVCVSLKKFVLTLSNANHLGRFNPYPSFVSYYVALYPNEVECILSKDYDGAVRCYYLGSKLDVNKISCEKVIDRLESLFL